jgi:hypothetical protein
MQAAVSSPLESSADRRRARAREAAARYRAKNREKCTARVVAWRAKNPEKCKAAQARWRAKNTEKCRATAAAWQAKNPEKVRANNVAWRIRNPKKYLLTRARSRAKKQGIPCTITEADIHIPTHCPALGIELKAARGRPEAYSPSLDKIIPALGYVPGNVQVISHLANVMKNNATVDQLRKFAEWVRASYG